MIEYGTSTNYTDEYLRIGEDSPLKFVRLFMKVLFRFFSPEYLLAPNEEDIKMLMVMNEAKSWPGMRGSMDCMHWRWKEPSCGLALVVHMPSL